MSKVVQLYKKCEITGLNIRCTPAPEHCWLLTWLDEKGREHSMDCGDNYPHEEIHKLVNSGTEYIEIKDTMK